MPPKAEDLSAADRAALVQALDAATTRPTMADVLAHGRGPLRRLNRESTSRTSATCCNCPTSTSATCCRKTARGIASTRRPSMLDMSRVQLAAYLDAAEAALRAAMVTGCRSRRPCMKQRVVGTDLSRARAPLAIARRCSSRGTTSSSTSKARDKDEGSGRPMTSLELALFRSASWPYLGTPKGFVAKHAGPLPGALLRARGAAAAGLRLIPAHAAGADDLPHAQAGGRGHHQ